MTTRQMIDDFLSMKRLAIVGVSRQPRDFTRSVFREFQRRGYDVVPVNPNAAEVDGQACFARVQNIQPPVDGALLMTRPNMTDEVVRDCLEAGIQRVWMYRATGFGAVSRSAVAFCEANGIRVIAGHCPYMFWRDSGLGHRIHGFLMRLTGSYPR